MKAIHLMAVGAAVDGRPGSSQASAVPLEILDELSAALARVYRISCRVRTDSLDPAFALDALRGQYYSTAILAGLQPLAAGQDIRILGVTAADLYVPILTFVFGEAQLNGPCALVSLHRLREEFYGLPANPVLLRERLVKEAVHELGHTFGLRHCADWRCAMASTHAVERLDLKEKDYCPTCRNLIPVGA